jgi:hypothetical protein
MSFLLFAVSLLAVVAFAIIINRLTGTRASYIESLQLEAGEKELWRDTEADFAVVPRLGRALFRSYPRLRRHTVVWTDRRLIISVKPLLSARRMITHQIYFAREADANGDAHKAAREFFGGFYGRGFETIVAVSKSLSQINDKDCVRIQPTEESGSNLNIAELLLFTDRLAELRQSLPADATESRV